MDMDNGDKSKTNEAVLNLRQIYNQLVLLTEDKDFFAFIERQWEELDKGRTIQAFAQCKRNINHFLQDKKLPHSWLIPLYTLIKDKKLDFPIDNSISLRVGSDDITADTQNLLFIRDQEGHLLSSELSVSIVITGKVTVEHIIRFVKNNKRLIEQCQEAIGLPEYKNPNWKDVDLGVKIISMKDKKGMTFFEIADNFAANENLTQKEQNYYGNDNNIKDLYYRYKKRLSSRP